MDKAPIGSIDETKAILALMNGLLAHFHNTREERFLEATFQVIEGYQQALETGKRVPLHIANEIDAVIAGSSPVQ